MNKWHVDNYTITQQELNDALRRMGTKHLRADLRDEWSLENPTRNYCYVIAEFVYWYLAPEGSTAWELKLPGETAPHRFVKAPDGKVIDYAAEQFDFDLPYARARQKMFMQTGGEGPSKRAKILAEELGFFQDSWKKPLTDSPSPSNLALQATRNGRADKRKGDKSMATKLIGKFKGHEVVGTAVENDEGRRGIKIVTWTHDGKPVASKVSKGIVGNEFKSVSEAGKAVYAATNKAFGYPENLEGRHLKFVDENGTKPTRVKAEKPAKASKRSTKVVEPDETDEDEPDEIDGDEVETPKTTRAAKRAGKTANRAARQAKAEKPAKRQRVAKTPSAESYNIIRDMPDGRLWCQACCDGFDPEQDGGSRDECPKGHKTSDFGDIE